MLLTDVKAALITVLPTKTFHAITPTGTVQPYLVWNTDGSGDSLHGDGRMLAQVVEGTIDLFDAKEYSTIFGQVQTALNDAGIPFRLNSIQYEVDAKLFHYEWVFGIETEVF